MDEDFSIESWEAVEDVYEEMLDEEYELGKLSKSARLRVDDSYAEITDTDEEGGQEGAHISRSK